MNVWTMDNFLELSEKILERGHRLCFVMRGESMYPVLQNGDIIWITNVDPASIKTGDIIFYRTPSFFKGFIHRVIKRFYKEGKLVFITKGDYNPYYDKKEVYSEQVLGKVESVERNGRIVNQDSGLARIATIFWPSLALIDIFFYNFRKNLKSKLKPKILVGLLQKIQDLKCYVCLARKIVKIENISYRIAIKEDAALLARFYYGNFLPFKLRIVEEAFDIGFEKFKDSLWFFLAEKENKIIGGIMIKKESFDKDDAVEWWISNLFVNWRYRKLGIGAKLANFAIRTTKDKGAIGIKACVVAENMPANNLFKKIGGVVIFSKPVIIDPLGILDY